MLRSPIIFQLFTDQKSYYFLTGGVTMSANKTRGLFCKIARLLGDFSAIFSGSSKKMTRRDGRRVTGRAAGKGLRKLIK